LRTHAAQPAEMGRESRTKRRVLTVSHAKFFTRLLHEIGDSRVMDVTDAGEKVMFNLKIQATEQPTLDSTAA
jgi:hypothetical protein